MLSNSQRNIHLYANALVALHGSVLPRESTGLSFTDREVFLEVIHDFAFGCGAYHFFESADFKARQSSESSATIALSLRFSSSSSRKRLASLTSMPPNFERQL